MTTNAADTNNVQYVDPIEDAKQIAREAIHETWPTAVEIAEPTNGMYRFDAICIDEEECPVSAIAIMHDADAETFSLVEELRPAPATQKPIGRDKIKQIPAWPIDWERLEQAHEIAYLRGDLATSSPESYTLDEMREICEAMEASTDEIDAAMRSEFEQMPPAAQAKMLDLLEMADPEHFSWWTETLLGKMPDSAPDADEQEA